VIPTHRRKVTTGKEGLSGEIGTARTDLVTSGKVFVHGEL
jgi:membrane-bound ClpP family serine protease